MVNVLFELKFNPLNFCGPEALVIPLMSFISVFCFFHPEHLKDYDEEDASGTFIQKTICGIVGVITTLLLIGMIIWGIQDMHTTYKVLHNQEEYVHQVSGTVSGFVSIEDSDDVTAHFSVGGTDFTYEEWRDGMRYHADDKHTVIKGNGQNLKIRYYEYGSDEEGWEKYIIYIEELK